MKIDRYKEVIHEDFSKDVEFMERVIKELGLDRNKVNVKGGAIAIGHPLGATGTRLVGTLARILNWEDGQYGLANACIGGGQGIATVIEKGG